MMDKQSALIVTQAPIAKQKDCLHLQVFVTEDTSVLERVPQQLRQIHRSEEYVLRDSTVLLALLSQEIAHLGHFAVPHSW
jgi:hypothetical protein